MTTTPTSATSPVTLPPIDGSTATSGASSSGSAALSFTSNFNTFLTLLTTQLQNQDPLSPMDSNTFTQQLVSFSEVEQQIDTNNNLTNLIQLQTTNESISALPLVGQQIQYNSPTAPLENGQANFSYSLPSAAAQTALVVTDANGNVIYNTTGQTAQGIYSFQWNGQNNAGQQMPNGGAYTLQVLSADAKKNPITATVQSIGTVNSVSVSGGQAAFDIDGLSVPMSELVAVNPGNTSTTTTH